MFAVYSCCQPSRLSLIFPPDLSKFSGEMDSMPHHRPLSPDNQRCGASVPAPRVDCNRASIRQEIKAFVRMSSGLDLREYGWNGDGTEGNRHQAELLASMPGIVEAPDGELHFAEWN